MLALALVALFLPVQDRPPELCELSGTVASSSGEPLNHVEITAEPTEGGSAARTSSDSKGNFRLIDLKPGQYRLKGERNGYLQMYYGARRANSSGSAIALSPGQHMGDLRIRLMPYAVIAGAVRESDGEPVADVEVRVFHLHYQAEGVELESVGSAKTDDLGQYRIHDLPPGKYIATAKPADTALPDAEPPEDHGPKDAAHERLAGQAYGGSVTFAGARSITAGEGARISGIDFTLTRNRVFHVKGRVSMPPGMYAQVELSSGGSAKQDIDRFSSHVQESGDFDFPAVTGGSYILRVEAKKTTEVLAAGRYVIDMNNEESRTTVPVEVARDVDGLRIAVEPNAEIAGHITVEDADGLQLPKLFAYFHTATEIFPMARLMPDATFSKELPDGHYQIYVGCDGDMNGLVIRSIRSGSVDVLRDGLTMQGPGKVAVEIVLTPDAASLNGVAVDKDDVPAASTTVVAIPETAFRSRADRYFVESTDAQGHFTMKDLPPGNYTIFAWDDVEPDAWFDPEFLRPIESRGEAIKIEPKTQTSVKLHLMQ